MRAGALGAAFFFLAGPLCAAEVGEYPGSVGRAQRSLQQERKDLQEVREKLALERQRIRQHRSRERSLLSELQQVEKKIEETENRYEEQRHDLELVLAQITRIRARIGVTQSSLETYRRWLAGRLRVYYLEQTRGFWRLLAASDSFAQVLSRLRFFHCLAAQNADSVERLTRTRNALLRQRYELAERETAYREMEFQSRQVLEKIRRQRQNREQTLAGIREKRELHEQAARELSAASSRLNQLIRQLELQARKAKMRPRIPPPAVAPAAPGSRFPWPTRGRVVSLFGRVKHPRFDTYVMHKGIDIAGPIGQNVQSVANGRVLFAEWFEGYGRMIIVDHGNGIHSIYAHLQRLAVKEGDSVLARQTIGALGDSGSWTGPTLYFELRLRGEAVDPLAWLET